MRWMLVYLFFAALLASFAAHSPHPPAATSTTSITPAVALARAGVHLEKLLAAGVQPTEFVTIVSAARDYLTSNEARWHAADQSLSDARDTRDIAEREGAPSRIEAARLAVMQQETHRGQVQGELFAVVSGTLDTRVSTRLSRIRLNAREWPLPTKYLIKDRNEGEWIRLRDALSEVADAQSGLRSANPSSLATVAAADADAETVAAATALQEIAAARQAWREALRP